jgi:bifunctional DNase/RNase
MKRPFEPSTPDTLVQMTVSGVVIDPTSQVPVVVLRGIDEPRLYLPIFIGGLEATSIATVLANVEMPRPLTHDLLMRLLDGFGGRVVRVRLTRLEEGTFYAEVDFQDGEGGILVLDSRPSDALALALRAKAPVLVAEAVLAEAGGLTPEESATDPEMAETLDLEEERDARESVTASGESAEIHKKSSDKSRGPQVVDQGPRSFFGEIQLDDLKPEDFGKYKM